MRIFPVITSIFLSSVFLQAEDFSFEKEYLSQSAKLMEMIRKESPALLERLTEKDLQQALTAFLKAANTGITETPPPVTGKDSAPQKYPPLLLPGNILYQRMDQPMEMPEDHKKYTALILDLRSCNGKTPIKITRKVQLPYILLTGRKTAGSAELFAAMTALRKKGIVIGEPTFGTPFSVKKVSFGKQIFYIPVPPEGAEKVPYAKVKPAIPSAAFPQIEYKKLKQQKDSWKQDPALRRAVELLTALEAIQKGNAK